MKIIKLVAILAIAYFLFFRKEGYNYIELPPICDKVDPKLKCKGKRGRDIELTETSAKDCLTGKDAMVSCKDMYTKMQTANSTFKGDKGDKIIKQFMSQVAPGSTQVAPGPTKVASGPTKVAPGSQPITKANDLRKQLEDKIKAEMQNREPPKPPTMMPKQPTIPQPPTMMPQQPTSTRANELKNQLQDKVNSDIERINEIIKEEQKNSKKTKTSTSRSNYIRLSEL